MPGLGLSMELPPGWVGLDSTVPPSIIASTAARVPDLAADLDRLRNGELGFVAYDASGAGTPTPRLTIAVTGKAIPVATLLDALARQTAGQVAATETIADVQHAPVTLPVGPAAELRYTLTPKTGGTNLVVDDWFVSTAGRTFLLSFTGPAAGADTWLANTKAVAESLAGS